MTNMISFLHMDFEFTDERGWLRQLTHDTWKQVNVSQTKAGVFRGKHYHAHNREAFYIISGEIEIFLEKDFDFNMDVQFISWHTGRTMCDRRKEPKREKRIWRIFKH